MKTKTKVSMTLGLLLVLAGIAVALLFGWGWPYTYTDDVLGAWYAGDITAVTVENGSAEVRVYDTDGGQLEVTAEGWADSFRARMEDGHLYVTYDEGGGLLRQIKNLGQRPSVILWVPDYYEGSLTVRGGSGDAGLHGAVLKGAVELSVGSGAISVYDSQVGALTARSGSGDVFLGDVKLAGALAMASDSGLLYAEDVRGVTNAAVAAYSGYVQLQDMALDALSVTTDSGEIWLEELDANSLRLVTNSGNVYAELAGDMADYTITAVTDYGSSDLPEEFQSGDRRLDIHTGSGDIDVSFD